MRALRTAATGMAAQQLNVEVISNNIANMNTVGFKKQRAEFQDLLYQNIEPVVAATFADPVNDTVEEPVVLIVAPNLPLPASIPPPPKSNWWYNAVSIPLSLGGIAYLVYALCRDHERSLSNDYWGKKVNMHVLTPSHNMKGKETMPWRYTYYPPEPAWWRSWTFW